MLATTTPPAWAMALALSLFGIGATLGTLNAGRLTVRYGDFKACAILITGMIASQAFAAAVVGSWPLMLLSAFVLGFGSSMSIPLQTRLMDVAGSAQSMAAAMNHAAFNAANALGPWLAGMALTAGYGWRSSGVVGVGLSLAGMMMLGLTVWHARRLGR